jgi:hypothetical protein
MRLRIHVTIRGRSVAQMAQHVTPRWTPRASPARHGPAEDGCVCDGCDVPFGA